MADSFTASVIYLVAHAIAFPQDREGVGAVIKNDVAGMDLMVEYGSSSELKVAQYWNSDKNRVR